jgi:hypothetical protein
MAQTPSRLWTGEAALLLERGLCGWLQTQPAVTPIIVHADPPAARAANDTAPLAPAPVLTVPITLLLSVMVAGCLGVRS